jgi:apolipoprotein N-acyltransferase
LIRDLVRAGATLLFNVSNDSWMDVGDGVAPRQHSSMAVFRAVETRRFLVRASSGGFSGFVSPLGEMFADLPDAQAGTSAATVRLRTDLTPYVRWGEGWAVFGVLGVGASLLAGWRRA